MGMRHMTYMTMLNRGNICIMIIYNFIMHHQNMFLRRPCYKILRSFFRKVGHHCLSMVSPCLPIYHQRQTKGHHSYWTIQIKLQDKIKILQNLNRLFPNDKEQQAAYNSIMHSIDEFSSADHDSLRRHQFHFIDGPGGTGKSALFKKLHTTCW